ncbi:Phenylalanine--tRNA ligase beta subunit [uncultured archaeon]|nr:Phenylalanine--tRNA ligase beta subunit [uncultured archaeon]
MATLTISRKEFDKNVKLSGDISEKLMNAGIAVDTVNENEVILDITANRPDLLSVQGIFRHLQAYYGKEKGLKEYKVEKPEKNFKVIIDKSVKDVRPFTVCAIVKNLKFDEEKIKQIIDMQEKLHNTVGRNRKKLAIGIYPLEKITLPIKFEAKKPNDIKFQPLEFPREITGLQILSQHPTGRDYAKLLEGKNKFPIFVDAKGKVLSMPPIINSHETGKVSYDTKEVFVECSGFDFEVLQKVLNIIVTTLADLGGKIYAMELDYGKKVITPNLEPERMKLSLENANKLIGLDLTEKDLQNLLPKMGYDYSKGVVSIPAYRVDILHEVDIIEDVAVAYGYENLTPEIPKVATIGEESPISKLKNRITNILASVGLLEVSSLHLNTKDEIKKANYDFKDFVEVEQSKTEYNCLRIDLLTNILKIISQNSDATYPQKVFELGTVFGLDSKTETGIAEKERLAVGIVDESVNFTEAKQVLDYLFKMLGKEYSLEETENTNFISGRAGNILVNGKQIGYVGEIAPRVLKNWNINMPVVALELNIESLLN